MRSSKGASARQGAHQGAQKSTRTGTRFEVSTTAVAKCSTVAISVCDVSGIGPPWAADSRRRAVLWQRACRMPATQPGRRQLGDLAILPPPKRDPNQGDTGVLRCREEKW